MKRKLVNKGSGFLNISVHFEDVTRQLFSVWKKLKQDFCVKVLQRNSVEFVAIYMWAMSMKLPTVKFDTQALIQCRLLAEL